MWGRVWFGVGVAGICSVVFAVAAWASGAQASRTITLNDSGQLHRTSQHGFNLYESGSASGTLTGSLSLHLDVVSTNRVTATLTVSPKGGSMTGTASASYHNNGGTATFSGVMSISHGTGTYSHAHGSGLSFSGTIQRSNDAVTVKVNGSLSY